MELWATTYIAMWSGTASDTHDTTSTSTSHNDMFKASSDGMGNKEYSIDVLTKGNGGANTHTEVGWGTRTEMQSKAPLSHIEDPFSPASLCSAHEGCQAFFVEGTHKSRSVVKYNCPTSRNGDTNGFILERVWNLERERNSTTCGGTHIRIEKRMVFLCISENVGSFWKIICTTPRAFDHGASLAMDFSMPARDSQSWMHGLRSYKESFRRSSLCIGHRHVTTRMEW